MTESEDDDWSLEMFLRRRKDDFDFMCDWNKREESRMTHRLWTSGDGAIRRPST